VAAAGGTLREIRVAVDTLARGSAVAVGGTSAGGDTPLPVAGKAVARSVQVCSCQGLDTQVAAEDSLPPFHHPLLPRHSSRLHRSSHRTRQGRVVVQHRTRRQPREGTAAFCARDPAIDRALNLGTQSLDWRRPCQVKAREIMRPSLEGNRRVVHL
jgi:hypothetical protein